MCSASLAVFVFSLRLVRLSFLLALTIGVAKKRKQKRSERTAS